MAVRAPSWQLEQIRVLLAENPDAPLTLLLNEVGARPTAPSPRSIQQPAAAMQSLVGLLRATTRESMQLSILQLHQAIATHLTTGNAPAKPPEPSPFLMSPSALSSLLTPSASGFRVDFDAALASINGGEVPLADPLLDLPLPPIPSPRDFMSAPKSSGKRKRGAAAVDWGAAASSAASTAGAMLPPPPPSARHDKGGAAGSGETSRPGSAGKRGLNKPAGLSGLAVEVTIDPNVENGQPSVSSLSNAPLSAVLGAFGFGSVTERKRARFSVARTPPAAPCGALERAREGHTRAPLASVARSNTAWLAALSRAPLVASSQRPRPPLTTRLPIARCRSLTKRLLFHTAIRPLARLSARLHGPSCIDQCAGTARRSAGHAALVAVPELAQVAPPFRRPILTLGLREVRLGGRAESLVMPPALPPGDASGCLVMPVAGRVALGPR